MDTVLFNALANFLKVSSGLILSLDKTYLIQSRLQSVADFHGCASIDDLVRKLMSASSLQLKQDIIEAMTTNETSFFRDVRPFDTLRQVVLPQLIKLRATNKTIRILCVAASTGQEPYSIAMILAEMAAQLQGWRTDILGIDIDRQVLKRAEEAVYTQFETQRGLPIQMLMKYFDRNADGRYAVKPVIRKYARFQRVNILEPMTALGQFDVIFCRNVLIYFDKPTKQDVLRRLSQQIASDGYLFLGGAETVIDITDRFAASPEHRGLYLPRLQTRGVPEKNVMPVLRAASL